MVVERRFDLFASDIGELSFGNKGFCFSTNELLFENDNLRGVWLLVFEVRNLISNLLLTCDLELVVSRKGAKPR